MASKGKALAADDVRARLAAACKAAGSHARFARGQGLSASYVRNIIAGRRRPGDAVLRILGLQEAEPRYVDRQPEPVELVGADGQILVRAERAFS